MRKMQGHVQVLAVVAVVMLPAAFARGQCQPQWDTTIGNSWMDGPMTAFEAFDDGTGCGPQLYAAGDISGGVAKWDGKNWLALGTGFDGGGRALAVFDDGLGGGPALYLGGHSHDLGTNIARWDGQNWSQLGGGIGCNPSLETCPPDPADFVLALAVYEDVTGMQALYAGGIFDEAGDIDDVNNIARWDGKQWSEVAGGLAPGGSSAVVAMEVFDDGTGPSLYVGGNFLTAGGVAAPRVARWNGLVWSPVAGGTDSTVRVLAAYDDGSGAALYAGGNFTLAGGVPANRIARWNGAAWTPVGNGFNGTVYAIAGIGAETPAMPGLYAGGGFNASGPQPLAGGIARWDGTRWNTLGDLSSGGALVLHESSLHPEQPVSLYVGSGDFAFADGNTAAGVIRWGCPQPTLCVEDIAPNCGDGLVNVSDLLTVIAEWGAKGGFADINGDGMVNITDLLAVLSAWGPCA